MNGQQLHKYVPPVWASSLKNIPQHFVKLAQRDTPIHPWKIPNIPEDFLLFIKRDDLTGSTLSGNKVRKLEFILADALHKKCDTVITSGNLHSNLCRATAVAAKQLGLNCYLLQRSQEQTTKIGCKGNLLLSRMTGSHIIVVPDVDLKQIFETIADKLKQQGLSPYVIANGGSIYMGIFGYLTAFQEMINQNILKDFDDIVMTTGCAGSASGIAIANYLTGSKLKCHCVTVHFNAATVYEKINKHIQDAGLDVRAEDIIDVIDGYQAEGYGVSTQHDLETILEISSTTGVLLDPLYNITSIRAMVTEMNNNPDRFQGRRILYIHTGGLFNLFDGRMDSLITTQQSVKNQGQVFCWHDICDHNANEKDKCNFRI